MTQLYKWNRKARKIVLPYQMLPGWLLIRLTALGCLLGTRTTVQRDIGYLRKAPTAALHALLGSLDGKANESKWEGLC